MDFYGCICYCTRESSEEEEEKGGLFHFTSITVNEFFILIVNPRSFTQQEDQNLKYTSGGSITR